eukprot:XP_001701317.1 predicted protein [Chlamydomonas reinhardtii]
MRARTTSGGGGGGGGSDGGSLSCSPRRGGGGGGAGSSRSERAKDAARLEETLALAGRVAAYLAMESPASARVAASGASATGRTSSGGLHSIRGGSARAGGRPGGGSARAGGGGGGGGLNVAGRLAEWATAGRQTAESKYGVELPPEEAARAAKLVAQYEDACRRHGLHVDGGVSAALTRSFGTGVYGHALELTALALTSREAAAALAEVLPQCAHINALTLERCVLSADAVGCVLPALWALPLRRLATPNTDFPPAAWPTLQRALGRPTVWHSEAMWWQSLTTLALVGNAMSDQGLCYLVESGLSDLSAPQLERLVERVGSLEDLDLANNNLGVKAVGAMALALKKDLFAMAACLRAHPATPVRHINLSYNNLAGVAGQCLLRHVNKLMQPGTGYGGIHPDRAVHVVTTDCVVVPVLPPGGRPAVHHDGTALKPADEDSDDAGRRLRYRRDQRDPDRDRDRERRASYLGGPDGAGTGDASASAVAGRRQQSSGAFGSLDLGSEIPDRQVAALLVEHEMEGRRHGYLSLLYGFKWQGRVDGEEVSPLDLVFSGWSHALPRAGALELVVAVLPPALCPWLANRWG